MRTSVGTLIVSLIVASAVGGASSASAVAASPAPTTFNGVIPESTPSGTIAPAKQAAVEAERRAMQSERKAAAANRSAAATSYSSLSISIQRQQGAEWCVPASTRAALSAFTSSLPSQSTFATEEATANNSGTRLSAAVRPLNSRQTRNGYVYWTGAKSGDDVFAQVRTDVRDYKAPAIPAIQGSELTIWKENGYSGNHAVVLYGYGSDNVGLQYFDPLNKDPMYGLHTARSTTIYNGMKDLGAPAMVL